MPLEVIMTTLATTRMSSKGQVVIPEDVRKRLNLRPGSQFVVVGEGDVVILKAISPPTMEEFDELVMEARRRAKQVGLKRADVEKAVAKVRNRH
jgi:AbrB family looped-hinge helix DNA binding protein